MEWFSNNLFHTGVIYSAVSVVFLLMCYWCICILIDIFGTLVLIYGELKDLGVSEECTRKLIHLDNRAIYQEIKNINTLTMKAADEKSKEL